MRLQRIYHSLWKNSEKANWQNILPVIFIIVFVWLGITARAFCYQAEVIDISGTKYFPAVKEALLKAEKSIKLVMFTIESSLYKKIRKLINFLMSL